MHTCVLWNRCGQMILKYFFKTWKLWIGHLNRHKVCACRHTLLSKCRCIWDWCCCNLKRLFCDYQTLLSKTPWTKQRQITLITPKRSLDQQTYYELKKDLSFYFVELIMYIQLVELFYLCRTYWQEWLMKFNIGWAGTMVMWRYLCIK